LPKPWGRYELGYTRHAKFLALTGNAFALWWEAKNHCDENHTDGLFPKEALRTFRFNAPKSVELLTRSCGPKPNGDAYAPLWEKVDIGGVHHYRMHDYLVHNDCRDEVLERLQDADDRAELRRARDRQRKIEARQHRKAKLSALRASADASADGPPDIPPKTSAASADGPRRVHPPTQTEAEAETQTPVLPSVGRTPTARSKRPIFTGQRLTVFEWQLDELSKTLGPHTDAFGLDEWFYEADRQAVASGLVRSSRDWWPWLEQTTVVEAQRRGLPVGVVADPYEAELAALMKKGPSVRP
jgi:hypothetical protein